MLLLHVAVIMTVAMSAFVAGHEVGLCRFQKLYEGVRSYAIALEDENSRLNQRLRKFNHD